MKRRTLEGIKVKVMDTLKAELEAAKPKCKRKVSALTARSLEIALVEYAEEYTRQGEEEEEEEPEERTWPDGHEMYVKLAMERALKKARDHPEYLMRPLEEVLQEVMEEVLPNLSKQVTTGEEAELVKCPHGLPEGQEELEEATKPPVLAYPHKSTPEDLAFQQDIDERIEGLERRPEEEDQ